MSHLTLVPLNALTEDRNPSAGELHRDVLSLFPDDLGDRDQHNILWRVDGKRVLIRSDIAPTRLPDTARTRPEPSPEYAPGTPVRFTLTINPVTRTNETVGPRVRRRETIGKPTDIAQKALAGALDITDVHSEVTWNTHRKGAPLSVATITGIANITSPDTLAAALRTGIGRAKAFGCGMLTVLPA